MWLFVFDGARLLCSCFQMGLVDRGTFLVIVPRLFRAKCQMTKIGTCSQHRDGHWSRSMVFKRINYSVLIWFYSGLGTVGFSFLVMLLVCGFVTLVGCVGHFSLL